MKKLLALILCLCLSLGAVAFATELNKDVLEGQTTVMLTIDPEDNEFVVVIPATVEIDPETREGFGSIVLKAGWKLPSCNSLSVRLKSAKNGVGSSSGSAGADFYMKNENGTKARYRIISDRIGGQLNHVGWESKNFISVSSSGSSTSDIVCDIEFSMTSLPTEPGVYTDVLTFAVVLN